MKQLFPFILLILTTACSQSQANPTEIYPLPASEKDSLSAVEKHYLSFNNSAGESRSTGTVSNGSLENGHLLPFSGANYHYFDTNSYLHNRCFMHLKVKETVLSTYKQLETTAPNRLFGLMECSNEHGIYSEDSTVQIDFELMAIQLLTLIDEAKKQGLTIEKIIWKMELRDELFATASGKRLKATGIYVTTKLSPLINALHDDHYHVDFKLN